MTEKRDNRIEEAQLLRVMPALVAGIHALISRDSSAEIAISAPPRAFSRRREAKAKRTPVILNMACVRA